MVFWALIFFIFWKNVILPAEREDFEKTKTKKGGTFGQIFSSKKGNFWTDFQLYSIYIYICISIYIYIYSIGSKICPKLPFLSQKAVQIFFFSLFVFFSKIFFSLQGPGGQQGEWDFSKKMKNKKTKITIFLSQKSANKCCATYLDRFLTQPWRDFWLNLFHIFGLFFLKICWNPYFYRFPAKNNIFVAQPRKLGTRFVKTSALTDFLVCPFSEFLFFWCVRFWGSLKELKNKNKTLNTKQPNKKQDHKMQTRKPLSLVYKKQTTQTQNNAASLFRLQTDNPRNKKTRTKTLNTKTKLLFNPLNLKKHQNCRENNVFHWLQAKQETRRKKTRKSPKTKPT